MSAPARCGHNGEKLSAGVCRYCCRSPKLLGASFSAVKKSDRRSPIDVASITLPRLPASLSSGDEVPRIFTRKSRVQPKEFLITSAKRLLQQYLPIADLSRCSKLSRLLEHLVGSLLEKPGHIEAERLGGLEVDRQHILDRCLRR